MVLCKIPRKCKGKFAIFDRDQARVPEAIVIVILLGLVTLSGCQTVGENATSEKESDAREIIKLVINLQHFQERGQWKEILGFFTQKVRRLLLASYLLEQYRSTTCENGGTIFSSYDVATDVPTINRVLESQAKSDAALQDLIARCAIEPSCWEYADLSGCRVTRIDSSDSEFKVTLHDGSAGYFLSVVKDGGKYLVDSLLYDNPARLDLLSR